MPDKKITSAQDAPGIAGRGDKSRHARAAEIEVPVGRHISKTTPGVTPESRREESDRQAIERGEDDGMIVKQSVASSAHNRRDLNAISGR
jgi:hypothetical protein